MPAPKRRPAGTGRRPAGEAASSRTRALVVVALTATAVFAASPLHLPLNNPNEGVRVFTVKALVEDHTFAIDDAVKQWGYIDDKSTRDGKLYASKAPLVSLLGALAYVAAHPFTGDLSRPALTRLARGFGDALPSMLFAFLLWRGLRRRVRDAVIADVVVVGTVLGSGVLASLNVLSGHALAALAPAAALVLVAPLRDPSGSGARSGPTTSPGLRATALAGLALACAAGAEYPAALACLPVAALAVFGPAVAARGRGSREGARRLAALCAGAAPVLVVVAAAHTAMFGAPWRTGYSFLENKSYQGVVAGTFFGIGRPHIGVLGDVLFSPEVGLFFYSPLLVAGLAVTAWLAARSLRRVSRVAAAVRERGARANKSSPRENRARLDEASPAGVQGKPERRAAEAAPGKPLSRLAVPVEGDGDVDGDAGASFEGVAWAALAGVALMLVFIAGFRGWRGGWSVGPRYITEVVGLLAVPAALGFDALSSRRRRGTRGRSRLRRLALRTALAALVAAGLLHSGIAGMFFPHLSTVFRNPVYEMMLPVVGLGFAPDSVPLWLGVPPAASAALLVVALFAPLVAAVAVDGRTLAAAVAASAAAVAVLVVAGPHLVADDGARAALEARRMLDNWRPEEGSPVLAGGGDGDPHALVAVDRARAAWPLALAGGCAPVSHDDLRGALADLAVNDVGRFAPGTLVVVPDRYALALAGLRSAANLFVVDTDLAHEARRGLPCSGNIWLLRAPRDPVPAPLRGHREVSRHPAGVDVDGAPLALVELER